MLLIQGKVQKNRQTEEALRKLRRQIPRTLAAEPLAMETVAAAADRLAREVLEGRLAWAAPGYDYFQIFLFSL